MNSQDESQVSRVPGESLDYDEELICTYNGERFTGIGYAEVRGHGIAEISHVDGAQDGPARDWYPSGQLKYEANYRQNARHGNTRQYRENGSLISEEIYEHSVLVGSTKFDDDGNLVDSYVISKDDANFA